MDRSHKSTEQGNTFFSRKQKQYKQQHNTSITNNKQVADLQTVKNMY